MATVLVNGVELFYQADDYTEPWLPHETVVLQHGFMRNRTWYQTWVPHIARRFRVIRPDLAGHGNSGAPPAGADWSLKRFADDLVAILDRLGLEKVHYCGESFGGLVGATLAAYYPERVRSLVLCSTPLRIAEDAQKRLAAGYADWAEAMGALGMRGASIASRQGTPPPKTVEEQLKDEWVGREWDRTAIQAAQGIARMLYRPESTIRELVSRIKAPTLILAPGKSAVATPQMQEHLNKSIAGSEIVWFPDGLHTIYQDEPDRCAQLAAAHFKKHAAKPRMWGAG